MLDINFIVEHPDIVEQAIKDKLVDLKLPELLKLHERRKKLLRQVEELNQKRNTQAETAAKQKGKPSAAVIAEGKTLKGQLAKLEPELKDVEEQYRELMRRVPNIPSDDTPRGPDATANKEVRRWGREPRFSFPMKDHLQLGKDLDLIDTERGVKVAGFRGYYLKNDLVMLSWALLWHSIKKMRARGFQMLITPTMVREMALIGSGHFPAVREEVYPVDDRFLVGTSEPALLAYRADEILDLRELPLKYCGISPCYRREVGSYGKDTKGLYRVHEFWKVEQVIMCENDLKISLPLFEEMLAISEEILQELKLPYRVVAISTGDMGAGKYKMYDIETWMPSRNAYGETHSCSHMTDWQTRRLQVRYRTASGKLVHPHAMNNTVIAIPRIYISLLEHYQEQSGSIVIPEVLRPYLAGQQRITSA